jgi:hypothetical protein
MGGERERRRQKITIAAIRTPIPAIPYLRFMEMQQEYQW